MVRQCSEPCCSISMQLSIPTISCLGNVSCSWRLAFSCSIHRRAPYLPAQSHGGYNPPEQRCPFSVVHSPSSIFRYGKVSHDEGIRIASATKNFRSPPTTPESKGGLGGTIVERESPKHGFPLLPWNQSYFHHNNFVKRYKIIMNFALCIVNCFVTLPCRPRHNAPWRKQRRLGRPTY